MKQPSGNNQLDNFIKEKLKSTEGNLPGVDWSEIEVLLVAKRQPLSISVNKKQILISAIALLALLGLWGIFKTVQYYRSLPTENIPSADSTQHAFNVIDTSKQIQAATSIVKLDTVEIDSFALTEKNTDSILKEADALSNKINTQQTSIAEKTILKPDKKQKLSKTKAGIVPIDSSAVTTPVEVIPPPDTTSRHIPAEIKIAASDSANISSHRKKTKKGKNKKEAPETDTAPVHTVPLPAKSDSVK